MSENIDQKTTAPESSNVRHTDSFSSRAQWDVFVDEALASAFSRLAPAWDVRDFVAVNPFFGMKDKPFLDTINYVQAATGASLLPKLSYFKEQYNSGVILDDDLEFAIKQLESEKNANFSPSVDKKLLLSLLETPKPIKGRISLKCLSDIYDEDNYSHMTGLLTKEVSKWAAAYFDEGQSLWKMPGKERNFYYAWKNLARRDPTLDKKGFKMRALASSLPAGATQAIHFLFDHYLKVLDLDQEELTNYFYRLICTVQGWASYFQKFEFEAQRSGDYSALQKIGGIVDIVAVRMAYDVALLEFIGDKAQLKASLKINGKTSSSSSAAVARLRGMQDLENYRYVWLLASENAYRRQVLKQIAFDSEDSDKNSNQTLQKPQDNLPSSQMAFCIDVRSEVMRRHIEQSLSNVQTIGFAGFFGVPIAVKGLAHAKADHQCPVLLNAAVTVTEKSSDFRSKVKSAKKSKLLEKKKHLSVSYFKMRKNIQSAVNSCFSFVEAVGLAYFFKMLRVSSGLHKPNIDVASPGLTKEEMKKIRPDVTAVDFDTKFQFAAGALKNMSLTENFSKYIFLFGHGSESANNPYASGLDCGACAGHNGLHNSRVLVDILNDKDIRAKLSDQGINIPAESLFLSGWHNTTLDELDVDMDPDLSSSQVSEIQAINSKLELAEQQCRKERSEHLSFCRELDQKSLKKQLFKRANDWSEIRPEWGLSRNASFVVARRKLTRTANFSGRSFLHDYDSAKDSELSVLELIMTAPMIVTNWINMQYYASTVDPDKFGSGNKSTHNVVGQIGCVQGNSGDLLGGLSQQSVWYDGKYFHQPLRLQVFIEAPTSDIDQMINKHDVVRDLVANSWLNLVSMDPKTHAFSLYQAGRWVAAV